MRMLGGTGYFGMFACLIMMMGMYFFAMDQRDVPVDQVTLEVEALMPAVAARTISIQSNEAKATSEELPLLGFLSAVHGKEVFAHAPPIVACMLCSHNHMDATLTYNRHIEARQRSGPHMNLTGTHASQRQLNLKGGARYWACLRPRLV